MAPRSPRPLTGSSNIPDTAPRRPPRAAIRHLLIGLVVLLTLAPGIPAPPAAAQAWTIRASTGWLNFGPLVRETDSYVRLGNMGSDIYFGLSVERALGRATAVYAGVITAPTSVMVWPRQPGDADLNRFSHRPFPGTAELTAERDIDAATRLRTGAVSWTCGSAGVVAGVGWARAGAGPVVCGLSRLDAELWGEDGFRVAPGLEAEVTLRLPVTAMLHLAGSCNASALLNHRGFVRMREGGAVPSPADTRLLAAASVAPAEQPRLEPLRFALPLRCGLGAGIGL